MVALGGKKRPTYGFDFLTKNSKPTTENRL